MFLNVILTISSFLTLISFIEKLNELPRTVNDFTDGWLAWVGEGLGVGGGDCVGVGDGLGDGDGSGEVVGEIIGDGETVGDVVGGRLTLSLLTIK